MNTLAIDMIAIVLGSAFNAGSMAATHQARSAGSTTFDREVRK